MDIYSLIDTLLDSNKWPTYTNSKVLSQLSRDAQAAFTRDTFDGYVAYVLISHQVCEDYAILLLRHVQFTLRLHVLPTGFGWPTAKYEQPGVRENKMFGRIVQALENSMEFDQKHEFIAACREQGEIRNRLAHKLVDGLKLSELRNLAQEYAKGDKDVVDCFNDADEHFSYFYCQQVLDTRWDAIIAQQIDSATDALEVKKWKGMLVRLEDERRDSPIS